VTDSINAGILIVGASLAGYSFAKELRQLDYEGPITLIGEEIGNPYERPPLSKSFLSGNFTQDKLYLCNGEILKTQNIDYADGVKAIKVDIGNSAVLCDSGIEYKYEKLVISTGARPKIPPSWPRSERVMVLRTLQDALALKKGIEESRSISIVGAGFIGSEVAAICATMGLEVNLIDGLSYPMAGALGEKIGQVFYELHKSNGVNLYMNKKIIDIKEANSLVTVKLDDESNIESDLALVAIGVAPNTEWLSESGISSVNGVVTDEYLQVRPNIMAIGDVARFEYLKFSESLRIEHYVNATEQAFIGARNLLDVDPVAYQPPEYFWSDQYNLKFQMEGLNKPGDDVEILHDYSSGFKGFAAAYHRGGRVTAVCAIGKPRLIALSREYVKNRAPVQELLDSGLFN
jgi:3-phenylpropionate/trans-cinnamate dioxygenase ferredoxin reductase subunit